jgi:hypothetical protein
MVGTNRRNGGAMFQIELSLTATDRTTVLVAYCARPWAE